MQGHGIAQRSDGIAWNRYGNAMTGNGNELPIKATQRQGDGARGCGAAGKCAGAAQQRYAAAWHDRATAELIAPMQRMSNAWQRQGESTH